MSIKFKYISKQSRIDDIDISGDSFTIFYGSNIDDRSNAVINYFTTVGTIKHSNKIFYTQVNDSFSIDEDIIKKKDIDKCLHNYINTSSNIIIDCTTLSYMEILTLLNFLNNIPMSNDVDLFYVEPVGYNNEDTKFEGMDFHLSYDSGRLAYIKPFFLETPLDNLNKEKAVIIVFLGFEDDRINTILERDDFNETYQEVFPILAVPAFEYGWENISISKHIGLIDDRKLLYSPSDNPYSSYKLLNEFIKEIPYKQIVIMPFGTKPNTVASAIFMVNYKEKYIPNTGMASIATQFDFPIKSEKRSYGVKEVHHYSLRIN